MTLTAAFLVGQWLESPFMTRADDIRVALSTRDVGMSGRIEFNIIVAIRTIRSKRTQRNAEKCQRQDRFQKAGERCSPYHFRSSVKSAYLVILWVIESYSGLPRVLFRLANTQLLSVQGAGINVDLVVGD